jgi:hypothetical protein
MTLLVKFLCFAQTNFERENKEALDRNSPGLRVSLRTQDGRGIFHLFETIPIELDFASTHASDYSIELDEVMNFAGQTNRFEAFPGDTILLPAPVGSSRGVVCCETHRRYLSSQPSILERELTDYLRFERPG